MITKIQHNKLATATSLVDYTELCLDKFITVPFTQYWHACTGFQHMIVLHKTVLARDIFFLSCTHVQKLSMSSINTVAVTKKNKTTTINTLCEILSPLVGNYSLLASTTVLANLVVITTLSPTLFLIPLPVERMDITTPPAADSFSGTRSTAGTLPFTLLEVCFTLFETAHHSDFSFQVL